MLDISLTWGRATKFDIPSPRNLSMMSSCTGLAKFIAFSAIAGYGFEREMKTSQCIRRAWDEIPKWLFHARSVPYEVFILS
jgi:hypothetical protein